MRRKKRTTLMSTTIAVFIGLNMQVRRDNRAELITLPLLHLTPLLVRAWKVGQLLASLPQSFDRFRMRFFDTPFGHRTQRWGTPTMVATQSLIRWLDHLSFTLNIGITLTGIGLRSVLYGLGAPL
jgi:hypothetical protein